MKLAIYRLDLTLEGPLVTASSAIAHFGVDLAMARTPDLDHPHPERPPRFYLPATLLKGLLREAWQQFGLNDEIQKWLGEESARPNQAADPEDDGPNEPNRGRLSLQDALDRHTDAVNPGPLRFRTKIDPQRGSVDEGALLMIESPYEPGTPYTFTALFRALLKPDEDAELLRRQLLAAFLWITAAGAEKTVGFGRLLAAQVSLVPVHAAPLPLNANRLQINLSADRPVCFAKPRLHPNLFEAEDFIPGAALKAAVAQTSLLDPPTFADLRAFLHAIVFSDLFPSQKGARPVRRPLSVVLVGSGPNTKPRDAIHNPSPPPGIHPDIRFSVDWKTPEFQLADYPWPKWAREVRVRTAIDGDRRKAKDESLFAYESVVPEAGWLGTIDLSSVVPDAVRSRVNSQLQEVLSYGLLRLGKTKAYGTIALSEAPLATAPPASEIVITLQTPALLLNPKNATPAGLLAAYQTAWSEISSSVLKLKHFFHRTRLHGGEYIYRRFQSRHSDHVYRPYLLTEAGSVFVFEPNANAAALLHSWRQSHLPIPPSTRKFYTLPDQPSPSDWKICPCLPENGFGEFAVNLHLNPSSTVPLLQEQDYV